MDFYSDMLDEARKWLETWGVTDIHTGTDPNRAKPTPVLTPVAELHGQALGVAFFRTLHRLPVAWPRRFEQSSQPLPELTDAERAGLAKLKEEVEQGIPLWPRLSRRWVRGQTDGLLNDWGIFHFHLHNDPAPEGDGFLARSCHVALAMVTPERFLLIAVRPHGSGVPAPWYEKEYLAVLEAHWPEELPALPGVQLAEPEVSDPAMIRRLRAAGLNVLHQVGDRVVMSPGGGMSLDGGSSKAVNEHNRYGHKFRRWEQAWAARFPGVTVRLRYVPDAGFLLESQGQLWWAVETPSGSGTEFIRVPSFFAAYLQQRASRFPGIWTAVKEREYSKRFETWPYPGRIRRVGAFTFKPV